LRQVGEVLIDQKLLTPEQLDKALQTQKESPTRKLLGEVIVELGYCSELQILEALAEAYDVPFARLNPQLVDPAAATTLERKFVSENAALPLYLVDGMLTVAVSEPANVYLTEELATHTGHMIQLVASPRSDILATAEAAFQARPRDTSAIKDLLAEAEEAGELEASKSVDEDDLSDDSSDSPVVKLVQQLIVSAVREGASDIHIEPGDNQLRVRFRVDGRLYEKMRPPFQMRAALVSRVKILAGLDIAERRLPQDGAIRISVDDRPIDLRVSTLPNAFGEKVVMRILDTERALVGLDSLGMDPEMREAFEQAVRRPHGLVLVTGPTGSGKSTTLYSALSIIINPEVNICTVEDPVEYNLAGINQFQVRESIGLTFAQSLRALLRQDPDVIMVGEIRDPDTARIAVQAALTGHLVLSTLHTNDGPGAVSRIQNLGVEPYLISASLEAVLAQRLIRRICPRCKIEVPTPPHIRHVLEQMDVTAEKMFSGRGCTECHQSGTKGRLGIYEYFLVEDHIRDAITTGASGTKLRELALASGMTSTREDGIKKALAGLTLGHDQHPRGWHQESPRRIDQLRGGAAGDDGMKPGEGRK
jgi:type IV pilus assembly protein PilB